MAAVEPPVTRPARPDGGQEEISQEAPRPQPPVASIHSQFRHTETRATVYNYVGPELKRILGLSSVFVVVLVALTFVLR